MNISTDFEKTLLVKIAMKKSERWLDEHLFLEDRSLDKIFKAIVFERKINNWNVLISFWPTKSKISMLMYELHSLETKNIGEMFVRQTNLKFVEGQLEGWFKIVKEFDNVQ